MASALIPGLSFTEQALVSIFIESVLYGLFISLFISSTTILVKRFRNAGRKSNKILITVSILLFVLATIHISIDLRRVFDGFIKHGKEEEGRELYFSEVGTVLYLIKDVVYVLQTLVGDAFILYRLYLVWSGDKRVVLPLLVCFIASIGTGIGAIQSFALISQPLDTNIQKLRETRQWVKAFLCLTFSTNLISTILISSRIWLSHSQTRKMYIRHGQSLGRVAIIIIESGAIYPACLVIQFVLDVTGSYSEAVMIDAVTQVIGVVFSLVIVRVASGISSETTIVDGNILPRHMGESSSTTMSSDTAVYSLQKPLAGPKAHENSHVV